MGQVHKIQTGSQHRAMPGAAADWAAASARQRKPVRNWWMAGTGLVPSTRTRGKRAGSIWGYGGRQTPFFTEAACLKSKPQWVLSGMGYAACGGIVSYIALYSLGCSSKENNRELSPGQLLRREENGATRTKKKQIQSMDSGCAH